MIIKKYTVELKDGKSHPHTFETVKDALREIGVSRIGKIEEINREEEVSETLIDKRNVAVIARRTDAEIEVSHKSGHAPTFTRPALTKVFERMTVLELGETKVLESNLSAIGRYENNLNKEWATNAKEYEWVLYHTKGKVLTIEEANAKYKELEKLSPKEGNLTYMSKAKI